MALYLHPFCLVLLLSSGSGLLSPSSPLPQYLSDHLDKTSPNYSPRIIPFNSISGGASANESTLKYLTGWFRHGNRSPGDTYQGDPYPFDDRSFWPDGPKELSKVGKNQLFQLGKKLKYRYGGFLLGEYKATEVEVKSNLVDRDYMSAACLLAGLYPPEGHQLWNPELQWQPIPIWQQPYDIAKLTQDSKLCPEFYEEMMKAVEALNAFGEQHQSLLDYLNNRTQLNVTLLSDIYRYWEIFSLQEDAGLELPGWVKNVYPDELGNIHATLMAALTSSNTKMIKLLAGPILADLAVRMRGKAANGSSKKLHLEAVHETSINAILPGFGFNEPFLVYPGALLLLELHKIGEQHFVQFVYFKNSEVETPEILIVANCLQFCPLDVILQMIRSLTPKNWNEECRLK